MSGKGSGRRPQKVDAETFASNWERVFGKGTKPTVPADLPSDSSDGARLGATAISKMANVGPIPTAPAIYVDDATGA